jgi:hypothetical protein
MMSPSDIRNLPTLSNEARQAMAAAFDAMVLWRNEIFSANDRCLAKVLDHVRVAHRAMGWPEHITAATRDQLLKVSKLQTQMIDQVMDAWEQQLIPQKRPLAGSGERAQMPTFSGSPGEDQLAEMMRLGEITLAPLKLWMQTAELWQRSWAAAITGFSDRPAARPLNRVA